MSARSIFVITFVISVVGCGGRRFIIVTIPSPSRRTARATPGPSGMIRVEYDALSP